LRGGIAADGRAGEDTDSFMSHAEGHRARAACRASRITHHAFKCRKKSFALLRNKVANVSGGEYCL
jgi:hypothetical protein